MGLRGASAGILLLLAGSIGNLLAAPGALVSVGGGTIGDEIRNRFIELAGGKAARLLIVPQASSLPTAGEKQAAPFREKGMKHVTILDLSDPTKARAAIEAAEAIWIGGGQQNRLMDRLEEAEVAATIRKRHASGVPIGGTSAGAAVMSEVMIAGDTLPLDKGLALWPQVVVDQHFVVRKRFNRSLRTIMGHPAKVGVGIGESTAVVVNFETKSAEVVGAGVVTVIDARTANVSGSGEGSEQSWRDVRIHWLQAGESFAFGR